MLHNKLSLLVLPLFTTLSLQANDPFMQDPFGDDIFKEMMQMQQDMDKMFNRMNKRIQQRSTRSVSPLGTYKIAQPQAFVDKKDHYEYVTSIPKNKENQIDINAKDGVMSITAKIIEKHENKTANSYSSSSSMRMYQQSIPLPSDADVGSITADYKDNQLVISVKKLKNVPIPQSNIHINGKAINPQKMEQRSKEKIEVNTTKEMNETKEIQEKNSTKEKVKIDSSFIQ